jgi:2-oxoglutarate dehydrogenase E1 component
MIKHYRDTLDAGKQTVSPVLSNFKSKFAVDWAPFLNSKWTDAADTHVPLPELQRMAERVTFVPEGFQLHPTVARVMDTRKQMAAGKIAVDWGMAETLAYASLLSNGYDVRISGQDSGRGTFAHRHAGGRPLRAAADPRGADDDPRGPRPPGARDGAAAGGRRPGLSRARPS